MPFDDRWRNISRGRGQVGLHRGRGGFGSYGRRMMADPRARLTPQGPLRVNTRPSAFTIAKSFRRSKNFPWQQDLFDDSLAAAGLPEFENGSKLHVSNLDRRVSNDDIRELFSEVGELIRYAIHYDKNGRPSGSAEVVYARRSDAFAAMKRYNNVNLDGRPMRVEIMGANSNLPVTARIKVVGGVNGAPIRRVVTTTQAVGRPMHVAPSRSAVSTYRQRPQGGFNDLRGHVRNRVPRQAQGGQARGGGGRGRVRGGRGVVAWKAKEKSAEELDKELDKYRAEAMETS